MLGKVLLIVGFGMVLFAALQVYGKLTGQSVFSSMPSSLSALPSLSGNANSQEKIRPPGYHDFVAHVKNGLSSAHVTVKGKSYKLDAHETGKILKTAFAMELDTSAGYTTEQLPKGVMEGRGLICSLEFKSARSKTTYSLMLFKAKTGKVMVAIKAIHPGRWFVPDGHYDAVALHARLNELTYNICK